MKRIYRSRGIIAGIIAAVMVFGIATITFSAKSVSVPADTYEGLKIFSDVLSLVQRDYTEEKETKELIYNAIKGMLSRLDPHSSFMDPDEYKEMKIGTRGVFGGVGIQIGIKDKILTVIAPIEDTPAWKAGIKANDKIVKIEKKSTRDMSLDEAVRLMRGPKGEEVTIYIMREGFDKPRPFTIKRDIIKIKSVKFKSKEDNIGYVRIAQFQKNTSSDLRKALVKLKPKNGELRGLILDLRNNPGGLLQEAVGVSNFFLKSGLIVYTKGRGGEQSMVFKAEAKGTQPDYPIIILVNGGSASASEIVAGALQDHKRAVILGESTFGKGSVQTIVPLADGSALRLTTAKYYTPSGRSIQAKGIEPDIEVGAGGNRKHLKEKDLSGHLAAEGSKKGSKKNGKIHIVEKNKVTQVKGEDIQLERAIEYLKSWYIFKGLKGASLEYKKAG
ncbi:MAG: S41 family peptidase [Thermodesulfobacteriota bacterium]